MDRVLIAGCGYVGTALALELAARGDEVFGLRRRPDALPAPIRPVEADLARPASLERLPPALDAVVYAAAADAATEPAYRAAYVEGPRNLLDALARAGQAPRRLVYVSSTAVYAQGDGQWVDEASPTEPAHFTGARVLEGERVVSGGRFPTVVLRAGGIYGPSRMSLVEAVRGGRAARSGAPEYTNRIHRDDCAGALAHLLALPAPEPVYVGVDLEPAPRDEVLCFLAAGLGLPPPPIGAAAADGHRPRGSKRCSSARLQRSGYAFRYPTYREGYAAALAR